MTNPNPDIPEVNVPVENSQDLKKLQESVAGIKENAQEFNLGIKLTAEFSKGISSDLANDLLVSIKNKYPGIKDWRDVSNIEGLPKGIKDLINFLEPIANQIKQLEVDTSEAAASDPASQDKLTDADMAILKDSFGRIKEFQDEIGNDSDSRLQALNNTLTNIQKVLDHPTKVYRNQLLNFIYETCYKNLDSDDLKRRGFETKCVREDGSLERNGEAMRDGLKDLLDLIDNNIQDIQEAIRVEKSHSTTNGSALDAQGSGTTNVPGTQTPDVINGNSETSGLKTELPGGYQIISDVQISGIAGVALYNTVPQQVEAQQAGNEGGADGKEGLSKNRVDDAVNQLKQLGLPEGSKEERICLLEVGDKTLAVRLDSAGCLYPFAVDVSNSGGNRLVFLENNTSCIKYLENKLGILQDEAYIGWNGRRYVIGRHSDHEKSRLLIEPTTIAGQWVSPDLGKCLAFLNFTNYLRNEPGLDRGKFKNDNPDLKWKDGKLFVRVKKMDKHSYDKEIDDSEKWMYVDLQDFGLEGVSQESDEWRKFIKYNNSEQWEDLRHFDKLDDKFDYSTLDIQTVLDKQARRARAKVGARAGAGAGTPNPGVLGGGLGEKPTVDVSNGRDVLDSNSGTLKAVDQSFNKDNFGISGADVTVFEFNGAYYYQDGNTVHQVTGFTDQEATLSDGQSLSNGQNISELKLNFFQAKKLEITEGGAGALNSKLNNVYRSIVGKVLGNDVKISVSENRSSYVLNLGDDKSIILGGENFVKQGKIFGYHIDEPEEWMKVVCYAVDNYENLAKGGVVSEDESYGINEDNVSWVKEWVKNLKEDHADVSGDIGDTEVESNGEAINEAKFEELCKNESLTSVEAKQIVDYANLNKEHLSLNLSSINLDIAKALSMYGTDFNGYITLDRLKIINKDEARELSKYVGYLSLRGLDKVDDDVANELVNHVGTLRFLKPEISDAAIDSLKKHIGFIKFADTELTSRLGYIENSDVPLDICSISNRGGIECNLSGLTTRQAMILGRMESRGMLYLDNLRSLDRDIAGHLSLYDGGISLGGLEHIDLGVLKLLLGNRKKSVFFDGLKDINEDVANELCNNSIEISLNGITTMSKNVADVFSNGRTMSFNGIKKFDEGVSDFIGSSAGGLSLDGLETISDKDAINFGRHKKGGLGSINNSLISLKSLKNLTPNQAENLGKFEGFIDLSGLESIDDSVAEALANSKSVILLSEGNANKVTNRMNGSPSHDAQSKIVTSMAGFSTFLG